MTYTFRKAIQEDVKAVAEIYKEIILHEEKHTKFTIFQLDVYPTLETAEKAIQNDSLYVLGKKGKIYASMIANQNQPPEYSFVKWKYDVAAEQVMVIHLLCVKPSMFGQGIGREMLQKIVIVARELNCKVVRLDTGAQNKPAVALYTNFGFSLAGHSAMSVGGIIQHENHLFYELAI